MDMGRMIGCLMNEGGCVMMDVNNVNRRASLLLFLMADAGHRVIVVDRRLASRFARSTVGAWTDDKRSQSKRASERASMANCPLTFAPPQPTKIADLAEKCVRGGSSVAFLSIVVARAFRTSSKI